MREETQKPFDGAKFFKAFGLTISSCMHCPELLPSAGLPDVSVVYGDVPQDLPGANSNGLRCQVLPGQLLLDVTGVARFLVRNGREIVIDRHPDASDDDVRLFLLGSAIGALMHQRGLLVLHGSTVKVDEGCVVFLGTSGVGKSTLATVLSRRGYACLGDDICAVSIGEDGVPYAAPAYPQAKLWIDSLQYFGIDATRLRRVRPALEKRALPLEGYSDTERIPVKRVYVLTRAANKTELAVKPIMGWVKMRVLRDYTYRVGFLKGLDLALHHFKQIACVASQLPLTRISSPNHACRVDQVANAVEEDFRSWVASPA